MFTKVLKSLFLAIAFFGFFSFASAQETVNCSLSSNTVNVGEEVTWSLSGVPEGSSISWSGDEGLSGSSASVSKTYDNPGTYSAQVTVLFEDGLDGASPVCDSVTVEPLVDVAEVLENLSCSPSSNQINVGESVSWSISGVDTEGITFTWFENGDNEIGTGNSIDNRVYNTAGNYSVTVTAFIESEFSSQNINCSPLVVNESQVSEQENNGGGGGGSSSGGRRNPGQVLGATTLNQGTVLGTTTAEFLCDDGMYLNSYLRFGDTGEEVKKLQQFLNEELALNIPLTGYFGEMTLSAVKQLQTKYASEILTPWGITDATGIVYKTTRAFINNKKCPGSESMPVL